MRQIQVSREEGVRFDKGGSLMASPRWAVTVTVIARLGKLSSVEMTGRSCLGTFSPPVP